MTTAPAKPRYLAPNAETIPGELKAIPRWVVWRAEYQDGERKPWTKVPYNPRTRRKASSTNAETWATFDEAVAAYERGQYDGIGIVLSDDDDLCGVDLDHVIDETTGEIESWALNDVSNIDSYTERSPSGDGIRVIVRGVLPEDGRKRGDVEIYESGRYLTITGRLLPGTPETIEHRQAEIDAFHAEHFPPREATPPTNGNGASPHLSDHEVLDLAFNARNGAKFRALYDGDAAEYRDDASSADQAFCNMLAFWTQDGAQIDRIVRGSARMRPKWDKPHRSDGATYGQMTIENALAVVRETYKGRGARLSVISGGSVTREVPGSEWPELVPLDAPNLPRLDPATVPGWAGEYARALARETETPIELAVSMVLATCSAAAARRLRVMVRPGYFEPTNTWTVTAIPPGNRKSAVQADAAAPLVTWEREQAESLAPEIKRATSERKTAEARAQAIRSRAAKVEDRGEAEEIAREAAEIEAKLPEIPASPQLWTSDATPERLGSLMADHDECIAWLSSEGGIFDLLAGRYSNGIPNLDLVLKSWSGDPERVDRGSRPPVYLRSPRLTVALTPQPDMLQGLASQRGFRGRGLLGRFNYFLPPSPLGYRTLDAEPMSASVRGAYASGVRAMLDWPADVDEHGDERPHVVRLSADARIEWLDFARTVEEGMRPGGTFEHVTDWAGKAPGIATRIAAVLHGIENAHGRPWEHEIAVETMGNALAIMAVTARHSVAALQLMGADPTIAAARDLWTWIDRGRIETFTVRDAHRALTGRFARASQAREAIDVLAERGYVEVIEPPREGPGRPPSPTVNVRPEFREGWS